MSSHSRGLYSVGGRGEYFATVGKYMIHISVRTVVDQAIYSPEIVIWKALVAIFKLPTTKEAHCPIKERKKVINQNSATSEYYANHE